MGSSSRSRDGSDDEGGRRKKGRRSSRQDYEDGADRRRDSSRSRSRSRRSRTRSRSRQRSSRDSRRSRSRSRSRDGYSGPRRSVGGDCDGFNDAEGFRLHVGDLDPDAEKRDLEKIFGKYGPLKEIWMARSIPCFAFIVFKCREDAEDAQRKADGVEVCGRRIRVTIAKPRSRNRGMERSRGFDPNSKCYQCGERGHFSRDCPGLSKYGYKRPSSPGGRRHRERERDYY